MGRTASPNVRGLMHEAALKADIDPDLLSFVHSIRVIRRKLPLYHALPPQGLACFREEVLDEILAERVVSSRGKRKQKGRQAQNEQLPDREEVQGATPLDGC